ncbi:MAG: hypothetical protein J7503_09905 [Cellulomonas iranensis]|uniref:ATP/GTP-binding protein n=1 Tax=Cellulomonas iranensis TaxID=76862 RepID=A0ABU0GFU5_9CELL|nr:MULTISPECIES: hypothetical protein [Cellulomonas]MBO9569127.1 hypothetical protein [Cellulomonas iranensis]MDQ0424230.1 hypothetical protein [Cellulomonas iranensis]TFH70374.1 hypothetical protein E4A51_11215 [Cellulomonas sp. HD19AZ1]UCN13780.1 hypothetical protein LFM56_12835 [Cellulomonas iranensis]
MPRSRPSSRRPYGAEHVPLDVDRATGGRRSESGPDGEWTVQRVRGSDREYRCPGCDQLVAAGTPHVVAWRTDDWRGAGVDERRHWHAACWDARGRRGPTRR